MNLREVGYDDREWIHLAQDVDRWRAYAEIDFTACQNDGISDCDERNYYNTCSVHLSQKEPLNRRTEAEQMKDNSKTQKLRQ
ncbi:hypothetical protein ANN_19394 [Periplaneta americana]|uniref:Uncharacterized protein n=1 Tax=Periplaneta americana TaxID=6978 RepID=A0ABQ8SA05_PERAM|nr:hypothetical protein ANN_19394 [Periplaneta americana]